MLRMWSAARMRDERGAVAVLIALLLVILLGAVAFATDLARLRHEKHILQSAVDLGSLAGAGFLPVTGSAEAAAAEAAARQIAIANAPSLAGSGLTIEFGCVVSDPDGDGGGDSTDLAFACGPGTGAWVDGWTSRGSRALHSCNPYLGDLCNSMKLTASSTVPYYFAPVFGFTQGNTGAVRATACRGFCGNPSEPLDVAIVFDRTRSMTDADMANAKSGVLAVLEAYNDDLQWVGLVGLPYHNPSNRCATNMTQVYPPTAGYATSPQWQLVGLSSDYQNSDGSLNTSSQLVSTINCLQRTPSGLVVADPNAGGGHTNLGDPMDAAGDLLLAQGRPEVPDVVIFFTDGEANQPRTQDPCDYFYNRTAVHKANGIEIYTIGYGIASARCQQDTSSGRYTTSSYASTVLADVSTQLPDDNVSPSGSLDNAPGGCAADENVDQDHYFCETGGTDLDAVFRQVAIATVERSRLIDF